LTEILLCGLTVFLSFTLEVVTGFGGTVMAVSFVTALLGMHKGVVVLTLVAIIPQLSVVIRERSRIDWKNYLIIAGLMLPFLFVGRMLQSAADTAVLKRILACFIIAVSAFRLIRYFSLMRKKEEQDGETKVRWYSYLALVGAGVIHGMFSSGGPLAIVYASSAVKEKDSFRSTMCLLWVTLNTILVVSYIADGSLNAEIGRTILCLVPFVAAGIIAGNLIVRRVNEKVFSLVVYICLLVTGVIMLL
jgi:uncharacterized membrane protein YfcA